MLRADIPGLTLVVRSLHSSQGIFLIFFLHFFSFKYPSKISVDRYLKETPCFNQKKEINECKYKMRCCLFIRAHSWNSSRQFTALAVYRVDKCMVFERTFFSPMIQCIWFALSYKHLFHTNLLFLLSHTYVSNLGKLIKPTC